MGPDFHTGGIPYEEDVSFADRAHWSFSGFNNFRERLAREIGAESLKDVWTYDHFKKSLIYDLLNHSDCDGELSPEQCGTIWAPLDFIVNRWPADDYDRIHGLRLSSHMLTCHRMNRPLLFR